MRIIKANGVAVSPFSERTEVAISIEETCCGEKKKDEFWLDINDYLPSYLFINAFNAQTKPLNVIFHDPATIVYWNDGTKTVVKCDQRDTYSKEAGLAMCYMKKMCGSSRAFNDVLKEWAE